MLAAPMGMWADTIGFAVLIAFITVMLGAISAAALGMGERKP